MLLRRYACLLILTLSVTSPVQSQGQVPANGINPLLAMQQNWMNFQWMNMMSQHFMSLPMDEATRFGVLDAMLRAANTNMMLGMVDGANTSVENVEGRAIPMFPTQ